jgi:hypothetical protein
MTLWQVSPCDPSLKTLNRKSESLNPKPLRRVERRGREGEEERNFVMASPILASSEG